MFDVAEDDQGNATLLGEAWIDTLVVDALAVDHITPFDRDLFLVSFDHRDRPRWLTAAGVGPDGALRHDAHVSPRDVVLTDSGFLVSFAPHVTAAVTVRTHRGDEVMKPLAAGFWQSTLASFDPGGQIRDLVWGVDRSQLSALTPAGPGRTRVAGDVNTPNQWTDPDGVVHPFDNPDFPSGSMVFSAEVDDSGRVLTYETKTRMWQLTSSNTQPDGTVWWGGAVDSPLRTFGEGTGRAFTVPDGQGGVALQYDADGAFHCGLAFMGHLGWVSDVQQDALGGLVVVGEFSDDLTVVSPDGTVAFRDTEDSSLTDGFIARFAPAPPP